MFPFSIKQTAYAVGVALIFAGGFKTSAYFWSNRYDSLVNAQAKAIVEMRDRLLDRIERINSETEDRERNLLRDLETSRRNYDLLSEEIATAPLTIAPPVVPTDDGVVCRRVDWFKFGRLYDDAADPRGSAEVDEATRRNDAAAGVTETR